MNSSQPLNPQEICENFLLEGKRYNNERSILSSENAIADRLLARENELQDAYEELHYKLHARPQALQILLGLVLSTAAFWNRQFDLKYWPSLDEFLQELAYDSEKAVLEATDPLTAAARSATRSSKADFFKALFAAIEENTVENHGLLPRGFKLTDRTVASLANCALDLGPDELIDDAYIKRFRQRERNGVK